MCLLYTKDVKDCCEMCNVEAAIASQEEASGIGSEPIKT